MEVAPSRTTAALTVAWNVLFRLALGGGATFAVGLVAMIAFDERAIPLPSAWGRLDGFGRALIGLTFFAGCALPGIVLWALALPRDRSLRRDLAAHAGRDGEAVPIAAQREPAAKIGENVANSGAVLALTGGILVLVCGIASAMVDGDGRAFGLIATAISAGIAVAGVLLYAWGKGEQYAPKGAPEFPAGVVSPADKAVRRRAAAQRAASASPGAPPARPRENTIGAVAGWMLRIGGWASAGGRVSGSAGARGGGPPRGGDPARPADPVEWLIDTGLAFSAGLTAVAVAAFTVGPILGAVVGQRARLRLREAASGPAAGSRRPGEATLRAQLSGPSPLRIAATLLAMWGSGLVWGSLAAAREAAEGQEPFVGGPWDFGLRLGVVLVSVLILVEWIALREHVETATRLRRAWPVVDPPPAKPEPDPGETS